jgi:ribosome-binding protein aMBF1 (putative translation factor)
VITKEITNEREYRIARAEYERFAERLAAEHTKNVSRSRYEQAMLEASQSRLAEMRIRLAWYERVRNSGGAVLELESLDRIPDALIQARIAAGLTQRQLAERLGVKEQQVQRDEQTRYARARFDRLVAVAKALDIEFHEHVVLPSAGVRPRNDVTGDT